MKQQRKNSSTEPSKEKAQRYAFAQRQGDNFSCIKILEGDFEGVIYKYNHVKFAPEPNKEGKLPLKFDYDIMSNPNKSDVKCEEFKQYIGDILIEVVEQQLIKGTLSFNE